MAKERVQHVCSECGAVYTRWQGQCSACKAWNTLEEEREIVLPKGKSGTLEARLGQPRHKPEARLLAEVVTTETPRIDLQDGELNRVLGGGLVPGSFLLLGGEPGIGKSTLVLQTILRNRALKTLYVSGEESATQLKLRADRLSKTAHDRLLVLCSTCIEEVLEEAERVSPDLLVIDSIQTMASRLSDSSPGSSSQIRECAGLLLQYAKSRQVAVLVVGHITKDGAIAGPKVLEHTVDTVLQFEGDKQFLFRILRCQKNRFGSTQEIGIYEMRSSGLQAVENPSRHLLSHRSESLSGSAVAVILEGMRPILIETQALVSSAIYANPQRSATGFDLRRLNMLLAVLEKRVGFKLLKQDVFLNIAGGLRIDDPAADLSVLMAVLSSGIDRSIPADTCFAGEVGLSGEIRAVSRIEQRIQEAARIGFRRIVVAAEQTGAKRQPVTTSSPIEIVPVSQIEQAFRTIFSSSSQ